jgi:hypothetical protein
LTRAEGRRFGLTVGAAFGVLAGLSWWRGHEVPPLVLAGLGSALIAAGLLAPTRLGPVFAAWMRFALLLSKITTPLLMSLVYFVVILPVGLVVRRIRHPLARRATAGSYWVARPAAHGDRRRAMERQF